MVFLKSVHHGEQLGTLVQVLCGYQKFKVLLQWDFEIFLEFHELPHKACTMLFHKNISS